MKTDEDFKGLGVVPLLRFDATDTDWLTSDEATAAGALEVTEVSEAGSVPALRVVHKGDRAVFLLDSEAKEFAKPPLGHCIGVRS